MTEPTKQTHEFVTGSSTGLCWQQVERPNGSVAPCAEPIKSPIHDPAAYLAYHAELTAELGKWERGEGEYAGTVSRLPDGSPNLIGVKRPAGQGHLRP